MNTKIITVTGDNLQITVTDGPVTPPVVVPPITNIQDAVNATPVGGTLLVPTGTYPGFRGKNGITVRAAGAVKFNGNVDLTSVTDFVLDGWLNKVQAFSLATFGVNWTSSVNCKVIGCLFTDTTSNFGDNGSAIAASNSTGLLVANNAFIRCAGNVIGSYNFDFLRAEGNDFIDCNQVMSANCFSGGNKIEFVNNYVSGERRAGIETGGDSMHFADLLIQGNMFVDLKGIAKAGPLSYVGRPTNTGKVLDNYFERGPNYDNGTAEKYSEAIELYGSAIEVARNTVVDFSFAMHVWNGIVNAHDNKVFNTPTQDGWTVLPTRPARPSKPPRMKWPA